MSAPDIKAVLTKARDLVSKGWLQGHMAADRDGDAVCATSHLATCFCAVGAIDRAVADMGATNAVSRVAWFALAEAAGARSIPVWNDKPGRTKDEVVAVFDKALAACG